MHKRAAFRILALLVILCIVCSSFLLSGCAKTYYTFQGTISEFEDPSYSIFYNYYRNFTIKIPYDKNICTISFKLETVSADGKVIVSEKYNYYLSTEEEIEKYKVGDEFVFTEKRFSSSNKTLGIPAKLSVVDFKAEKDNPKLYAIIGGSIGGAVGLALIVLFVVLNLNDRKTRQKSAEGTSQDTTVGN